MNKEQLKMTGTEWLNDPRKLRVLVFDMLAQIQGKKIMDARRKRAAQMVLLGVVITLGTLVADVLGAMRSVENFFYDKRARYFQYTMPAPSESLVHLDIDDGVLEAQNLRWPWPRSLQARIIKEMTLADPKVIFLDITYQESDREKPEEDVALADAIRESGRVLAPVTLGLGIKEKTSETRRRLVTELMRNLKESPEVLATRLGVGDGGSFGREYILARKEAARNLVLGELQKQPDVSLEVVLRDLLGMNLRQFNAFRSVVEEQYVLLNRERALGRFTAPLSKTFGEVVVPTNIGAPIVEVSNAAASSGFVDYIPSYGGDSKVRYVPLFVNLNGRVLPHVSLVMACRYWGVPIEDVKLEVDKVTVPHPGGAPTVIPVRTLVREGGATEGNNAMFVADIPWFGNERWESMYDMPNHKLPKQHLSLTAVTNILDSEKNIRVNVGDFKSLVIQSLRILSPDVADGMAGLTFSVDQVADFKTWATETIDAFVKPAVAELEALPEKTPQQVQRIADGKRLVEYSARYFVELDKLVAERVTQREELKRKLGGKVVLVGFTATGLVDLYPTPLHAVAPGVVAHGAILNGILTNHFWGRAPAYYTWFFTVALGVMVTLLVAVGSPQQAVLGAGGTILAYGLVNGLVLFDRYDLVVGVAGPMMAMGLSWAGVTAFRFVAEIVERKRIQDRFQNYVDPELVNYVVENPEEAGFAGREKEMTVVFTDLEGFTTLSERLGPAVVAILNDYVAKMTPVIRGNRGFVDKFLGDGIMFEFNAVRPNPAHATDALNAVIGMQGEMVKINEGLVAKGLPTLRMRVGVNTGLMIVGDAGGGGASNFTVLGDNVNLAARLESANKFFGSLMLMTESTLKQTEGRFAVRPIARLIVKGKETAVMTYEPLGLVSEITPEQQRLIELTTEIYDRFVAADFEGCMTACDLMDKEIGVTKFAKLYHKESALLIAEGAGPDFDGTVTLSEK